MHSGNVIIRNLRVVKSRRQVHLVPAVARVLLDDDGRPCGKRGDDAVAGARTRAEIHRRGGGAAANADRARAGNQHDGT